jgi:hypothetical protein
MDSFLKTIAGVYAQLDGLIAQSGQTSCASCTEPACCNQKIVIDLYEGLTIAMGIRATMDTPKLRHQLRTIGEEMERTGPRAWFGQRRACAFLFGGRCTVYSARPSPCRLHHVRSPPPLCIDPDGEVRLVDHSALHGQMMGVARTLHKAFGLAEDATRVYMGALPRVVAIALEALDHVGSSFADMTAKEHAAFTNHIQAQEWPTAAEVEEWAK